MPQVSLYVDEQTMEALRKSAASEGVSLSRHVANRLKGAARCATLSGLPEGLLENLYGCLSADDSFKRPDQIGFEHDAARLAFE